MSSFHEVQFPPDISYGSTGGPGFSTGVVTTSSGGEQRNQNWAQSRCKYNVAHGVKNQKQLDNLIAFFRARKGKAYGFRFKDWSDFKAVGQICGVLEGNKLVYQLQKTYVDSAGFTDIRLIKKPVSGTVTLYISGVMQTSGYTVDYVTGRITFDAIPAGVVTADFEYDVPCRFDTDEMPINIDNWSSYSWSGITVIEIKW
ncbi:hypothetical protein SOV_35620 [Sporomusa ovata DSM 2662]|uniref:DUF2460 domain-containing protein n=2 Tax=Sporomusa ovata TaxID=2378 RepID=UPI00038871E9|nr:TIGR02217 family protein [Sporomusa ovata]EQB24712.1 glycoside hydrolase, family 24 [Sporomusa ovata DSM 2662]